MASNTNEVDAEGEETVATAGGVSGEQPSWVRHRIFLRQRHSAETLRLAYLLAVVGKIGYMVGIRTMTIPLGDAARQIVQSFAVDEKEEDK